MSIQYKRRKKAFTHVQRKKRTVPQGMSPPLFKKLEHRAKRANWGLFVRQKRFTPIFKQFYEDYMKLKGTA